MSVPDYGREGGQSSVGEIEEQESERAEASLNQIRGHGDAWQVAGEVEWMLETNWRED